MGTSIVKDYNAVRNLYINGSGKQDLPHFVHDKLHDLLPYWNASSFEHVDNFWLAVEHWQILCNTVREHQRMLLSDKSNEVMLDAAFDKGGPLNLPIRKSDLP